MTTPPTFTIGGDLEVARLGFGAMRITGSGVWGWPADRAAAKRLLRRAVELGVQLIDTADAYGPETSLYQLHAIDDDVPLEESLGALARLQAQGKIRHVGVSNFSVAELERARKVIDVVTVQNRYNLVDRAHEPVLDYCAEHGIGFIPWFPLAAGKLTAAPGFATLAQRHQASAGQLALAWLLRRSPVMLPIPGTSSIAHLEDNMLARAIVLSDEDVGVIEAAAG